MVEAHRRHCSGRWRATAITARIIVCRAVAGTVIVVIDVIFGSRSILRRSHHVISLCEVLTRSWLGGVGKSQAGSINDAIVPNE